MEVGAHVATSEGRTGKAVESVEVFAAKEGWFGVGYCWYFYDAQGRVVDAEWEYGKGDAEGT
jgi:hypothetical protein